MFRVLLISIFSFTGLAAHSECNFGTNAKRGPTKWVPFLQRVFGGVLLSHTLSSAVPSALEGLASGFGMGPGVSPPLWPP